MKKPKLEDIIVFPPRWGSLAHRIKDSELEWRDHKNKWVISKCGPEDRPVKELIYNKYYSTLFDYELSLI